MRVLRIVVLVAAAFVALLVVGALALLIFVDPNRYRGDIERLAREHTGRPLTIQGKLELKLFPWLALSVHDVRLGNPPGFGTQSFAAIRNASVGVKLLPLLAKRIEVRRVALDGLSVDLVSRGDANNWKDLTGPNSSDTGRTKDSGGASATASIEGVDISQAELVFEDQVKKTTSRIASLEIHTGRLSTLATRAEVEKLDLQGAYLSSPEPSSPEPAGRGAADSKPLAFSLHASQLVLDTRAQSLAPATLELKLGDLAVTVTASGERVFTDRVIKGSITVPKVSARELLRSLGVTPPVTRDSQALSALALKTNYILTQKAVRLSALDLALDDTHVQGSAALEDIDASAWTFDLNVNGINVDRYRAPVEKVPPAASGKAVPAAKEPTKPPTPLPLETLRKADATGTLRIGSVTFANLVFTNVKTSLVAKDGLVRLGPTHSDLYGGQYDGDIVLDARPVQAQLSLNGHLRNTDVGALAKAALDSSRIAGHADVNVAVAGVGNTDEALIRSLTGKIDASVRQGALIGVDIQYELQRATALVERRAPPPRTGPERTNFNSLQTTATLDKGVLRENDLRIETDFLKVHGGGTLDLTSQALDYRLVAGLYRSPPSQPGAAQGAAVSSFEVPLLITGTVASPTVLPDIEALAKGQLRQEVQKKAGDLIKGKLGDKLKDLLH